MNPFFLLVLTAVASALPTMDDFWGGRATFQHVRKFKQGDPAFPSIDAGTRIVALNGSTYLFGRFDLGASGSCTQGVISVNVRVSVDEGATWSLPHPVAEPDLTTVCMYADGSAFFDAQAGRWHYLVQQLEVRGAGGWTLAHFSTSTPDPFGVWTADAANPVVRGGQLFGTICAGAGKHCHVGTVDEGTPQIVEKAGGLFYVTFHGYDYALKSAVRGVAATPDFVSWQTTGAGLPNDAIFSSADCAAWNVSWAAGGCIGSGEASIVRAPSGYMYEIIEAADVALTCDLNAGEQWWPLGIVRSQTYAASPQWQQAATTPLMIGPHVGCALQYNSLWLDDATGKTWWAVWAIDFVNGAEVCSSWHMYTLVAGPAPTEMLMPWPGC